MNVSDFPASLQPIIQQGFLDREFQQAMRSRMGYRACADRVQVSAGIGETVTQTQHGLRASSAEPYGTEQWTAHIRLYAATIDLNLVTDRIGIASQFLQNAYVNGEQAARGLDELAWIALFAAYGADPLRPHGVKCASDLNPTHTLMMIDLLRAVAKLEGAGVPQTDGAYNCHLDPVSARQLFADPDFKQLFQGATSANQVFRKGMTSDFLGLRFLPTIETTVRPHPTLSGAPMIRRPIICGQGALVEADFSGLDAAGVAPADALVAMIEDVAMVTYQTIERLQQIIAQSWYWIGGFAAPADTVAGHQRAVVIEHIG